VQALLGHELREDGNRRAPTARPEAEPLLRAEGVTVPGAIEDVSITVRAGEIVGLGGLVGSGRTTLLRALAGLERHATGRLWLEGREVPWPHTPRRALGLGIALIPEDRKTQGLVLGMSAMDNITMSDFGAVAVHGFLSRRKMGERARAVARDFGFSEARVGSTARKLSGGNQQKVLLAKWRHRRPRLLLLDEPTRGIDVGAKEEILETLRRLAAEGLGLVVVSSELEEVVAVSDRVCVLSEGQLVSELDSTERELSVGDILHAAFKVVEHERG
jgi:ABC-type sugar transport system ATPase subunit